MPFFFSSDSISVMPSFPIPVEPLPTKNNPAIPHENFFDLQAKGSRTERQRRELARGELLIDSYSDEIKTAETFLADCNRTDHYRRSSNTALVYNSVSGHLATHSILHFLGLPMGEIKRRLKMDFEIVSETDWPNFFPGFDLEQVPPCKQFYTPSIVLQVPSRQSIFATMGKFWRGIDQTLLQRAKASGTEFHDVDFDQFQKLHPDWDIEPMNNDTGEAHLYLAHVDSNTKLVLKKFGRNDTADPNLQLTEQLRNLWLMDWEISRFRISDWSVAPILGVGRDFLWREYYPEENFDYSQLTEKELFRQIRRLNQHPVYALDAIKMALQDVSNSRKIDEDPYKNFAIVRAARKTSFVIIDPC